MRRQRSTLQAAITLGVATTFAAGSAALGTGCGLTLDFGQPSTGEIAASMNDASTGDDAAVDANPGPAPAVCGNGVLETGEQCDLGADRNGGAAAGCDANCRVVCCAGESSLQVDVPGQPLQSAHCYAALRQSGTEPWSSTRARCKNRGGDLVAITSEQELAFVDTLIVGTSFIGGFRDHNGDFQWVTGEPWFDAWAAGANPPPPEADRVVLQVDGFHGVVDKSTSLPNCVCERPAEANALCPDAP
jgi:hypothetical protein